MPLEHVDHFLALIRRDHDLRQAVENGQSIFEYRFIVVNHRRVAEILNRGATIAEHRIAFARRGI